MNHPESRLQQSVMQWWARAHRGLGLPEQALFAIPNGGRRHIATAVRMKREGLRAGAPDLFLALPARDNHGLFIELKAGNAGRVTAQQREFHQALARQGYAVHICRSLETVIGSINYQVAGRFWKGAAQ